MERTTFVFKLGFHFDGVESHSKKVFQQEFKRFTSFGMRSGASHKPNPRTRATDIIPLCIALFRRMTLNASVAKVWRGVAS